jgi:hypothetical protein
MASHRLTDADTAGAPTAALDRYLAELATRLHGPRRNRAAVLAEIRDGLTEAAADSAARGMPPAAAATTAVSMFGTPAAVADADTTNRRNMSATIAAPCPACSS